MDIAYKNMNIQDKIRYKSRAIMLKNKPIDDDVTDLVELLFARIDELLEVIEHVRNNIQDISDMDEEEEEEDIPTYSNRNDTSSEYYNEDARNQKDDLD